MTLPLLMRVKVLETRLDRLPAAEVPAALAYLWRLAAPGSVACVALRILEFRLHAAGRLSAADRAHVHRQGGIP